MIKKNEWIVHFHVAINTSHIWMHHVFKFIIGKKIKTLKLAKPTRGPPKPENMSPVTSWVPGLAVHLAVGLPRNPCTAPAWLPAWALSLQPSPCITVVSYQLIKSGVMRKWVICSRLTNSVGSNVWLVSVCTADLCN